MILFEKQLQGAYRRRFLLITNKYVAQGVRIGAPRNILPTVKINRYSALLRMISQT